MLRCPPGLTRLLSSLLLASLTQAAPAQQLPADPRSSFRPDEIFRQPQLAQAYGHWRDGRFADVVAVVQPLAEQGHPAAQYLLGKLYSSGEGVPQDDEQAIEWWRMAAEQGLASAQNELGVALTDGWGVEPDPRQAAEWLRKAAAQGMAPAQVNLGLMYLNGVGVRRNEIQAVELFRQAAELGLGWAQYYLGVAYADGRGLAQNQARAVQWIRRAAEQDYTQAQVSLGMHYLQGRGVVRDDARAVYWFARAAQLGDEPARRNLERLLAARPRMQLSEGTRVMAAPDAAAAVLRTAAAQERAFVLERRRDWVEVYLERGQTLGFVSRKAAPAQQDVIPAARVVTDDCASTANGLSGRQSDLDAQRAQLAAEAEETRVLVATQFDVLHESLASLAGEQALHDQAVAQFESAASELQYRVTELNKLVETANALPKEAIKAWVVLAEQIVKKRKSFDQDLAAARAKRQRLVADREALAGQLRLLDATAVETETRIARINARIVAYNELSAAFGKDAARYGTSCAGSAERPF